MLSGALIRIPDNLEIEKLNGVRWEREENDLRLRSVIQFDKPIVVDGVTNAQAALAIHQEIGIEAFIHEEEGRYSVRYANKVVTKWANIHVMRGLMVVDRLGNRDFVTQTINKGLNLLIDKAHNIYLDTAKMAADHANQWIRGFSDRLGRVDRGTLFGEGVEQDSIFGPELGKSRSKTIGWVTNFFGSPVKVRVSPIGSIIVWSWPPMELFLKFLRMEILPYVVAI